MSEPGMQLIDAYRAEAAYFRRDGKLFAADQLERLANRMFQMQSFYRAHGFTPGGPRALRKNLAHGEVQ